MGANTVTVNDLLDGHTALDPQCLDRIYLNAYISKLQTSAQVVAFLSGHLGFPFPSRRCATSWGSGFVARWPPTPTPTTSRGSRSASRALPAPYLSDHSWSFRSKSW